MTDRLCRGFLVLLVMTALASLVPALALAQAQTKITTTSVKGSLPVDGHSLYNELCAVCHGLDGRGDGPAATALAKEPKNLTQLARQEGGKFPFAAVRRYIEGADEVAAHGSRDMPIWGQVFRSVGGLDGAKAEAQLRIQNLTRYIESIQAK
jgi:mono/diheme cytochrome c family protein